LNGHKCPPNFYSAIETAVNKYRSAAGAYSVSIDSELNTVSEKESLENFGKSWENPKEILGDTQR